MPTMTTAADATTSEAPRFQRNSAALSFWLIVAGLLIVYCLNFDFLPGNDARVNVQLPANILAGHGFAFTAWRNPDLFVWVLDAEHGQRTGSIANWNDSYEGRTYADWYHRGLIHVKMPGYFLAPTHRLDPVTGEPEYANTFGIGAGLIALPLYAVASEFITDMSKKPVWFWFTGKVTAALCVALSAGFLFLIARRFADLWPSILIALCYGLGTCVWSTSSQTLWQHGPNELCLTLGTYFYVRDDKRISGAASGLWFGLAFLCRPTGILFIVAMGLYLLWAERRRCLGFLIAAIPFVAFTCAYNLYYFGKATCFGETKISEFFAKGQGMSSAWGGNMLAGLAGMLVSPSRGLFIYSPFLLFAFLGAAIIWKREELATLRPLVAATIGIVLIQSRWYDWWGGYAYGYRPLVDCAPFLCLAVLPAFSYIKQSPGLRWTFGALLLWSVGVQFVGAFAYDVMGWNALQVGNSRHDVLMPEYRYRLWELKDNQIVYYVSNFAAARNAKEQLEAQRARVGSSLGRSSLGRSSLGRDGEPPREGQASRSASG